MRNFVHSGGRNQRLSSSSQVMQGPGRRNLATSLHVCSKGHMVENDLGDAVVGLLVHVVHHAVQQPRVTAIGHERRELTGLDEAGSLRQVQQPLVSTAEIQQSGTVEVLLEGGDGGGDRRVDDLSLVDILPVAVVENEGCGALQDPLLDHWHVEAVCQLIHANEVGHLLLLFANVDIGLARARHEDQLQTHQVLVEDVHELHPASLGLVILVTEHGLEIATEVAEQFLGDLHLVEAARGAVVTNGVDALEAELRTD